MRRLHYFENHPRDDLFLYASGSGFSAIGEIRRITIEDVTYEYIDEDNGHPDYITADIFSLSRNLELKGIHCKVTHNIPWESDNPYRTIKTRRCCLQFLKLTENQARILWIFLSKRLLLKAGQLNGRLQVY